MSAPTRDNRKRARSPELLSLVACDHCRARKVRCDRQRPDCSNCLKAGVPCSSNGERKRVNHAKEMRGDLSVVLGRLEKVDQTLGSLTDIVLCLARQVNQVTEASACFTAAEGDRPNPNVSAPKVFPDAPVDDAIAIVPSIDPPTWLDNNSEQANQTYLEVVELQTGGERSYGAPAPVALFSVLSRQIDSILGQTTTDTKAGNPLIQSTMRHDLQRHLLQYPFHKCLDQTIVSDGKPITAPPRTLLDSYLDPFLRDVNSAVPVLDSKVIDQAINACYNDPGTDGQRPAFALILNNIVLLGLHYEDKANQSAHTPRNNNYDDSIQEFIGNCDRALANLQSFARPSLLSVQALITLSLVAQEFYHGMVWERVCQMAAQTGREIGLNRSKAPSSCNTDTVTDRQRIFGVLYSMDKHRVLSTGHSYDLHLFDTDMRCNPKDSTNETVETQFGRALDYMMWIWEEVYLNLYSARATSGSASFRNQCVQHILGFLSTWTDQYSTLLAQDNPSLTPALLHRRLELKYCYHVTHLLVLRQAHRNAQDIHNSLQHARECLRVVTDIGAEPIDTTRLATLSRIHRNYPLVAFPDLVSHHLEAFSRGNISRAELETDYILLRRVLGNIKTLNQDKLPIAYPTRVYTSLSWAADALAIVKGGIDYGRPAQGNDRSGPTQEYASEISHTKDQLADSNTGSSNSAKSQDSLNAYRLGPHERSET